MCLEHVYEDDLMLCMRSNFKQFSELCFSIRLANLFSTSYNRNIFYYYYVSVRVYAYNLFAGSPDAYVLFLFHVTHTHTHTSPHLKTSSLA